MTESQWLSSSDPAAMMEVVRKDRQRVKSGPGWDNYYFASDRKLRLFAVACCRQVWHLLTDERSRRAVEVAERYADGKAEDSERHTAARGAEEAWSLDESNVVSATAAAVCWRDIAGNIPGIVARMAHGGFGIPLISQAALLREIVGNPWRLMTDELLYLSNMRHVGHKDYNIDVPWLTWNDGTVPRIAQSIYDRRAFEEMPILADALMDAGCQDDAILMHCRGMEPCWKLVKGTRYPFDKTRGWRPLRSPHVRGCWVLDLLLGKE